MNQETKPTKSESRIKGQILSEHGLPAGNVTIRAYSCGFGGTDTKIAEGKTDDKGNYSLSYKPAGGSVNLEMRAVDSQGKELPLSNTKYNAATQEVLNLVVPDSIQPLAPEYQRLSADMDKYIGGIGKLGQSQENATRQDLSLLYQTTGWDARLVALASSAASLTQTTGMGQDILYALFRAGLPTDPQKLSLVSPTAVQKALSKANQSGIVSLNDQQMSAATTAFKNFASTTRLTLTTPGANSTYGDFFSKSGLNADQQKAFADLYFSLPSKADGLWQKAADLGIPAETLNALKLQGKLSYLTFNNATLAQELQQEIGSLDHLSQLPEKDFHTTTAWKNYLIAMAGPPPPPDILPTNTQALDKLIPPAYQGKTTADRLDAYAADLAHKVRLSFPTQVVSRMVDNGDLKVGANNAQVVTFLKNAASLGFQLGRTPLNSFIKQNQPLFKDMTLEDVAATTQNIKTLHRIYQITPSDESLQAALNLGFTSSYDIASLDSQDFIDRFGNAFPSVDEAGMVYRKAQQVNSVTLNIYTAAKQLDNAPVMYALSPSPAAREDAKAAIIKQFPTMQSLFGSLDFCNCEDCRSVLSPAAYLVDILKFLDPDTVTWNSFLTEWQNDHNNTSYTDDYLKPYDALIQRRPDLPNLPLTCENTNTVLPYIDIVNEILEYYIVNGQLDSSTAYDTGDADSADLVAEPQNILPQAYAVLNGALYPMGLPFDLWIETVRRFLGYFNTPLWSLLDVFKPADPLELFSDTNHYPYYRAAILAEYLGISPAEYAVFTNSNPFGNPPPGIWFKLYGYNDQNTALSELKSAKTLSIRLAVSYQDIVDIVSTGFLNPQLNTLVTLQKLGIQPLDVFSYEGQTGYTSMAPVQKVAFEAILDNLTKKYNPTNSISGFNARNWLSTTWNNGGFNQILRLADPDAGCNFDGTTLQYANGTAATPLVFLKLNHFVRLWKKLGWTMEETDRALQVFLTPNMPSDTDAHFGQDYSAAMQTALVYLAHLETLFQELQPNPYGRIGLLPLWSNIPTTGVNSLYAQLFLKSSSINNDPVFDDPTGNYLSGSLLIKDHLLALQGALNLTSDEMELILTDAGLDHNSAPLSLANVSLLYRYGLLAKALNLTVADFLDLKAMSGLNPFTPLKIGSLTVLADDVPLTETLEFVDVAGKVQDSGFKIEDLKYLLRHQFDPVGKYSQDPNALLQLVRSISNDIHRIQSENAVPLDPLTFTDDVIKQKLGIVFPADVVQTFMRMWTGTIQYTATTTVKTGESPLDPSDPNNTTLTQFLIQFPAIKVSYDNVKQSQQLTFLGVLVDTLKVQIETAYSSTILSRLLDDVESQAASRAKTIFQTYFEISTFGQQTIGFLPPGDFGLLFTPVPSGATDAPKRDELAKTFLPYLQQKLIHQTIVQAMASDLNADASLTDTLTTNANLLSDPPQPTKALLDAFTAARENGLSAIYYPSTDGTGVASGAGTALTADTTMEPKPAGTLSAHFEGYLEVPADGAYRFFTELGKKNAQAKLQFDFQSDPLILAVAINDNTEVIQLVDMKAGIPYRFTLDFHNLGGGDASLLVQGENLPKGPLNQLTLYPQAAVDRFARARVLLSKTLQLIQGFGLDEREVTYLITHSSDFNNLSFSALPTQASDDSQPNAALLFGQFLRLAAYTKLRQGPAGGTDVLIDVFENARKTFLGTADANQSSQTVLHDLYQTVADLTRRKVNIVKATAEQLGYNAQIQVMNGPQNQMLLVRVLGLTQEKGFKRLWDALQLVQTIGIPADTLAGATGIIDWTKSQAARTVIADNLKNTVKAHYRPDAWRPIAQSIFDKLRQEKRGALSAYLVNQLGLENIEQLFEYFLVDPGMEPVVKTSRIRLAISSVQTFIQRCLLNLEEKVEPSAIPANQWEWMKRYRVCKANREIFLWPENWLEPEWRLDKTDLFQALESALLQGDITNDLVEDAFFTYLKDLDVRARLDIVTMYMEEVVNDPASNMLHVIGRNHGKPQKYFYRRFAFGTWTAWEPVKVDIDGDHLAAVVWRDRLHLFWVTFAQKSKAPDISSQGSGGPKLSDMHFNELGQNLNTIAPQKQVQLLLNWSEYFQGKWADRKSSDLTRAVPIDVPSDFDPLGTYIHVAKEYDDNGNEGAVKIILDYPIWQAFRLVGKNCEPDLSADNWEHAQYYDYNIFSNMVDATKIESSAPFQVTFTEEFQTQNGQVIGFVPNMATDTILQLGNIFSLLVCDTPVLPMSVQNNDKLGFLLGEAKMLGMPFFYQDRDNDITLFVQPSLTETTITEWDWWVIPISIPDPNMANDSWWNTIPLVSQVPNIGPVNPVDPSSIYQIQARFDWATNPAAAISFGTSLIGQSGGINLQKVSVAAGSVSIGSSTMGILGNIRTTGSMAALSGNNLIMVGSGGLNLSGLQALKTASSAAIARVAVKSTINQAQGGIS
jgi:hypothetical protein